MSMHLICDWCHKSILMGQVYYTVKQHSNENDMFSDTVNDICCDCARRLSVDLNHLYKSEDEDCGISDFITRGE